MITWYSPIGLERAQQITGTIYPNVFMLRANVDKLTPQERCAYLDAYTEDVLNQVQALKDFKLSWRNHPAKNTRIMRGHYTQRVKDLNRNITTARRILAEWKTLIGANPL